MLSHPSQIRTRRNTIPHYTPHHTAPFGLIHTLLEHRRAMQQLGAGNDALAEQLQALRDEQANLENLQERVRALETSHNEQSAVGYNLHR